MEDLYESLSGTTSHKKVQEEKSSCQIQVGNLSIQTLLRGTVSHVKCNVQRKLTHKRIEQQ